MDKTTYLNHYYFVSILSFILIFLPANCHFSVDANNNQKIAFADIPRWNVDVLKLLIAIVYVYAGLAKINSDWIVEAMPLKIWLPANENFPIIGEFFNQNWLHYAFSWGGLLYDLGIIFLLLNKKTRLFGFALVIIFHVLTRVLFPIGIFPFVMILCSTLFFETAFHENVLKKVATFFKLKVNYYSQTLVQDFSFWNQTKLYFVGIFVVFHLLFPFRYLCYPNELFWTEEGYRFSWRVMLMEKAGYTQFRVIDAVSKKIFVVNNSKYLTPFQEKQMAFQPDFILEYAHYLHKMYKLMGVKNPEVYAESYVALNGRLSKKYIDPNKNLAKEHESFLPKTWILPFNDSIKGL